ncbi:MAG: ribosome maturation factor RimM [Brachymonas sp.]|nr:ribosome maturation factor RimM [Brachymonas sp.]
MNAAASTLDFLEPATLPDDAVEVARVGEAWGVKGWFKVLPYSASPEAIRASKRWYVQPPERGARHFSGTRLLRISQVKPHGDGLTAHSLDITDRNVAECLRGARVFVPRSSFPSTQADEYYWVDLIGCEVVNREGVLLGTVKELLATGPQTTLVLAAPDDAVAEAATDKKAAQVQRMIPFVSAIVDTVDVAAKRIVADWQPDYWD